jgi:sugar O-acyltransferase (sialic acid O-acetyltransferase NeuD family)
MKKLVLLCGGGHTSDLLGVIEACNRADMRYEVVAIFDDNPDAIPPARFSGRGVEVHRYDNDHIAAMVAQGARYLASAGYPGLRRRVAARADASGFPVAEPIVHPGCVYVATGVSLGLGSVVHAGVSISVAATIGQHCYLSHGALIGHDSRLGDFSTVMPGASLSGNVQLEDAVMVGSGAVILEGKCIGEEAVIGANAVVRSNVPAAATYVGIPAREIDHKRSAARSGSFDQSETGC